MFFIDFRAKSLIENFGLCSQMASCLDDKRQQNNSESNFLRVINAMRIGACHSERVRTLLPQTYSLPECHTTHCQGHAEIELPTTMIYRSEAAENMHSRRT